MGHALRHYVHGFWLYGCLCDSDRGRFMDIYAAHKSDDTYNRGGCVDSIAIEVLDKVEIQIAG